MESKNKKHRTAIDFILMGLMVIRVLYLAVMLAILVSLFTSCASSYNGCPTDYTTKYDTRTGTYKKVK